MTNEPNGVSDFSRENPISTVSVSLVISLLLANDMSLSALCDRFPNDLCRKLSKSRMNELFVSQQSSKIEEEKKNVAIRSGYFEIHFSDAQLYQSLWTHESENVQLNNNVIRVLISGRIISLFVLFSCFSKLFRIVSYQNDSNFKLVYQFSGDV